MQIPSETKNLVLYILKCIAAWVLVYSLSRLVNYTDYLWCLISAILVLSPDDTEAINLALTRIKANVVGGLVSLLCLLAGPANIVTVAVGFALAIVACHFVKIITASRTALAAVIIVMLHEPEGAHHHLWDVTLERIVSVAVGCVLGLIITVVFHRRLPVLKKGPAVKGEE